MGSKRGAGIDDTGVRVGDQGHGFSGNVVRKAQKRDIRLVDQSLSFLRVFAEDGIDGEQLDIFSGRQMIDNLQSSGTFPAVYKCLVRHDLSFSVSAVERMFLYLIPLIRIPG
jgi:hypothetical protein